jgi:pentatricopeptide repeat protein
MTSYGALPNIETYHILLKGYLQQKSFSKLIHVVTQMNTRRIQCNAETMTIFREICTLEPRIAHEFAPMMENMHLPLKKSGTGLPFEIHPEDFAHAVTKTNTQRGDIFAHLQQISADSRKHLEPKHFHVTASLVNMEPQQAHDTMHKFHKNILKSHRSRFNFSILRYMGKN